MSSLFFVAGSHVRYLLSKGPLLTPFRNQGQRQKLQIKRSEDEEIVAIVENDSCMGDAIQSVSGCTLGKGNLILKNYGKMAVAFINRANGESIRLIVKEKVIEDLMNSDFG
ncbi:FmdE family protein, partial [candidate division NPL-UPA2 bacterium]|nr:FmdE family protein [candidate division NPL-UPA2 bacterium]